MKKLATIAFSFSFFLLKVMIFSTLKRSDWATKYLTK
jgi:hypothetical protein